MYPLNADYEGVQYAAEYDFVDDDTIVILFRTEPSHMKSL